MNSSRNRWSRLGLALALVGLIGGALAGTRLLSSGETRPRSIAAAVRPGPVEWAAGQPKLLSYIPTYYKDVKPILDRNCVGCHVDGSIAPFKLTDAASAVEHARVAQLAVQSKRMPPWQPGDDSPKYRDELKLTDDEIAVIANWSWAGAPIGKASDAKPAPVKATDAKPDLTLDTGRDFKPDSRLSDEYRCFVIDPKVAQERYLSGYGITPGNARIVHHIILFQVSSDLADQARQLEAKADGRGGYTCFGGPGVGLDASARFRGQTTTSNVSFIGTWVPGAKAVNYPDGTGVLMKPGSEIIMQVHYNLLAGDGADRTAARLYFAPVGQERRNLRIVTLIGPVEIPCPEADSAKPECRRETAYNRVSAYQEPGLTNILRDGLLMSFCKSTLQQYRTKDGKVTTSCEFPLSSDRTIFGVQGHMHLLGTAIKLEANPNDPARRTLLLDIPRYDFHWQSGFWLEKPIDVNKGDLMRVTCTFDNSPQNQPWIDGKQAQPRYVVWAEGTTDEMCLGGLFTANR